MPDFIMKKNHVKKSRFSIDRKFHPVIRSTDNILRMVSTSESISLDTSFIFFCLTGNYKEIKLYILLK